MSDTTLGMLVLATPVMMILLAVKPTRQHIVTAARWPAMVLCAAVLLVFGGREVRQSFMDGFREHAAATRGKGAYRARVTPDIPGVPDYDADDRYTTEWYERMATP